jgi:hypothetical protein
MIRIRCQCGKSLKLSAELVGKVAACPQCKKKIRVAAAEHPADDSEISCSLIVQAGPLHVGEQIFPAGRQAISVGKGDDACLRLRGTAVSRLHCRLVPETGGWRVEDQRSTNGLFINGVRVERHVLRDGDVIRVGDFELRYAAAVPQKASARPHDSHDVAALSASGTEGGLTILDDLAKDLTATAPAPVDKAAGKPAGKPVKKPDDQWPEEDFQFADDSTRDKGKKPSGGPVRNTEGKPACPRCGHVLAEDAVICVHCGLDLRTGKRLMEGHTHAEAFAAPVTAGKPGELANYLKDCARSFAFFINPGNLGRFVAVAIVALTQLLAISFLGCFAVPLAILLAGMLCAYYFNTVLNAASGEEDFPDFTMSGGLVEGFLLPIIKYVFTFGVAMLPTIGYVVYDTVWGSGTVLDAPDTIAIALAALGAFSWPMIMLVVAMGGVDSLIRPDLLVRTVIQTFVPYVITSLLSAGTIVLVYYVQRSTGGNTVGMELGLQALGTYSTLVAMRCIGLYYHHFKERFAWSWG